MIIIGLVGGIASGKSYVAHLFEQLGAVVIDADQLGHQVLMIGCVREKIVQQFGRSVIGQDEQVSRMKLAEIVFTDAAISQHSNPELAPATSNSKLSQLEQITHPEIKKLIRQRLDDIAQLNKQVVILDAPVLFKAGWDEMCDRILFVEANEKTRLGRALTRGWTKEQFFAREKNQLSIGEKRKRATDVFVNDESAQTSVVNQARILWHQWLIG